MNKEIWLPDSTTHVITEPDGTIKVWDNIVMTKKNLDEKEYGFMAPPPPAPGDDKGK